MKSENQHPLSAAFELSKPAVAADLSISDYLGILRSAQQFFTSEWNKFSTWINTCERWVETKEQHIAIHEAVLSQFRNEMIGGVHKKIDGNPYNESFAKKTVNGIRRLHNQMQHADERILRPLIDFRSYPRLVRFLQLTETTKEALIWYEQEGTRTKANGHASVQTGRTRQNAISEAFTVLSRLSVDGLEEITPAMVKDYLGTPDNSDQTYRRRASSLHDLGALYRACVNAGKLPSNPLVDIHSPKINNHALRDFIVPDSLNLLRDLGTVHGGDKQQLQDRLICLLFLDLALRRSELEGLDIKDVRRSHDSFEIHLRPEVQKMSDRPHVVMPFYYCETAQLLDEYLRRESRDSGPLFRNRNGDRMREQSIVDAVARECNRLDIKCHLRPERTPTPHDFRRTFGMCNIEPLGLELGIYCVAERLRDSVQVAEAHYVRENPLIASQKAAQFRKKSSGEITPDDATKIAMSLNSFGISSELVAALNVEIKAIQERSAAASPPIRWIDGDEAWEQLCRAWHVMPSKRVLHKFLNQNGHSTRKGNKGRTAYDAAEIERMAKDYVPLLEVHGDFSKLNSRQIARLIAPLNSPLKVGRFVALRKEDVYRVISNQHTGSIVPGNNFRKTEPTKHVKQNDDASLEAAS